MSNYQVILADDHTLFRSGIMGLLKDISEIGNIYEAGTGVEVLNRVKERQGDIDLVILDLKMPEMTGVEVTRYLKIEYPEIKIIILSMIDQEQVIGEMLKAGANAYLLKNCREETLKKVVLNVLTKGYHFDERSIAIMQKALDKKSNQLEGDIFLTKREMEVLNEMFLEFSSPEIAEKLNISIRTVETHKTNLMSKTNTRNSVELIVYAIKNGLVDISNLLP